MNVIPSRYRQVAVASVPRLDRDWLVGHFTGREVYFRTRFVVARHGAGTALVEVDRPASPDLFVTTLAARVLAGPDECAVVHDESIDTAVPSQLATAAVGAPAGTRCVIVEGAYSHVSFILDPAPLHLRVVDIEPPGPAKLLDQLRRVLATAEDLPPIVLDADVLDVRTLLPDPPPADVLLPCRASGVELAASRVSFLNERPEPRAWTLLGCERSHQIHEWFYGRLPDRLDTCPRGRLAAGDATPTVTRCCLLQEGIEQDGTSVVVPWGASLAEVRGALDALVARVEVPWTPT